MVWFLMASYSSNLVTGLILSQTSDAEVSPCSSLEQEVLSLFGSLRASLLRYAISFGLSIHDGEDVIQEVFLALFRHLQLGRSRENLQGWVFRVTHNLALKRRISNQTESGVAGTDVSIAEELRDPAPGPDEHLLFNERQAMLLSVLRALPQTDQYCLRLRAEGLRYREISRILGISLGSVAASLARSLARMERTDRR